jgi:sugar phosphate isomerase/epimerase
MKLCFSTLGCPDWTLEQIAENGACYGFGGVELRLHQDGRHVDTSFDTQKRADTRRLFAEHKLEIAALSGYTRFDADDPDELSANGEALLQNAQLCHDLNAPYLRTFLGANGINGKGTEALRRYCDKVQGLGVTVLVEIHVGMGLPTGKDAAGLIKAVGGAGLRVLWDIHHSLTSGESAADTWDAVGAHIRHIHMKDACVDHKPCLPGKGVLPLGDVLQVLQNAGFGGYLSFEWEKTWLPELEAPETSFPLYIDYMKKFKM